ncbi:hypothetical protein D7Y23_20975 [Corallococcus sp. AB050B]|nr:hypothetical protein D7Y23_20975 [Corallococcus sp. AB050B]
MSRFRLLWVALLGLGLVRCTVPSLEDLWREKGFCAVGDEDCGMLRIRVDAQGFVPGCLRITARDGDRDAVLSMSIPYRGTERAGRTLTQGFSPPKDWGLGVTVTVDGFEQGCDGAAVANQQLGFVLREGDISDLAFLLRATDADGDGFVSAATHGSDCDDANPAINPAATELCNFQDDNCNGVRDEGIPVGETCIASNGCTGSNTCGENGAVVCFAGPIVQYAWADEDQDGYGDTSRGQVPVCTTELPSNRLPLSAPHNDCDDSRASVHPGLPELCNRMDDNCSGDTDEGFNVGTVCADSQTQCVGLFECDPSGNRTYCKPNSAPPTWYPDDDLDSYGAPDGGIASCARPDEGFVPQSGDCDDGNPFIHVSAPELCDEQDNNCDSLVDENGVCVGGVPSWDTRVPAGDGISLHAASVYGDGGVWVVGEDSTRMVKTPGSKVFSVLPGACTDGASPQSLLSVWAHPQTGVAFIGRDQGKLIVQTPESANCTPRTLLSSSSATVMGLQGVLADGGVDIHGVVTDTAKGNGGTFLWNGGLTTISIKTINTTQFRGVHGISPQVMFAVGGSVSSSIYRYDPDLGFWRADGTAPSGASLNAVHVVNPKLAYAVGTRGTLLRWNGAWSPVSGFNSPDANLTGVLAFGTHSIYVTSDDGCIYRYDGASWRVVRCAASVYGIAGNRPDDIWAVGRFGQVTHYPGWPQ